MAYATIQLDGQPLRIVKVPGEDLDDDSVDEWFRSVEFNIEDSISIPRTPYATKSQTFEWPGAEEWYGTCELPPMTKSQAAKWRAFLGQCRGMLNPFLLGDPLHEHPTGIIDGKSRPVCSTPSDTVNKPMSKYLQVRGLQPSARRLMLAGDYLQVGYRLHFLMDDMTADASGNATVEVWPSLREQPADGVQIVVNRPRGLFRLATNKRTWSGDVTLLQHMSVPIMEYL